MFEIIAQHLKEIIGLITALIVSIVTLIVTIKRSGKPTDDAVIEQVEKQQIEQTPIPQIKETVDWGKLKSHPLYANLLGMMNNEISEKEIRSELKRTMVQHSVRTRMRGWYNSFSVLISHCGMTQNGYILENGEILANWFYGTIKLLHVDQLQRYPEKYVMQYFRYISRMAEKTAQGVGDIYDNKDGVYDTEFKKLWAIHTLVNDTLESLQIIAIETADNMNGELEAELELRAKSGQKYE